MENDKNIKKELIESMLRFSNSSYASVFFKNIEGKNAVLQLLSSTNEMMTPTVLSQKLNVSKARVTAILNVLSKDEYVCLEKEPNDKRKLYVSITKKGIEYLNNQLDLLEKEISLLINNLGIENTVELVKMLKLINGSKDEEVGFVYE